MGLQKPWRWFAGLIAALLLIAAAFYFWWKSPKVNDIQWIPEHTDAIVTVNTREWIEAAIQAGSRTDLDSGKMKNNIRESGVNPLNPFWLFVSVNKQKISAAFELDNPELTAKFLEKNIHASRVNQTDTWQQGNLKFYIHKKWLYVFYKGSSNLVSANQSELFVRNGNLLKNRFNGEWLKGVFYNKIFNKHSIYIPSKSDIYFSLFVENNNIKIAFDGIEQVENKVDKSAWADFSFPVYWFGDKIQKDLKIFLKKQGIDTTAVLTKNSVVDATFFGIQKHNTSKITYAFDEEFNRVQTVQKMSKMIPSIVLQFQTENNLWWQNSKADSVSNNKIKHLNIFGVPIHAKMLTENLAQISSTNLQKNNKGVSGFMHINLDSFRNNSGKYSIPGLNQIPNEFKFAEIVQQQNKIIFTLGFSEYKNSGELLFDMLNKAMRFQNL